MKLASIFLCTMSLFFITACSHYPKSGNSIDKSDWKYTKVWKDRDIIYIWDSSDPGENLFELAKKKFVVNSKYLFKKNTRNFAPINSSPDLEQRIEAACSNRQNGKITSDLDSIYNFEQLFVDFEKGFMKQYMDHRVVQIANTASLFTAIKLNSNTPQLKGIMVHCLDPVNRRVELSQKRSHLFSLIIMNSIFVSKVMKYKRILKQKSPKLSKDRINYLVVKTLLGSQNSVRRRLQSYKKWLTSKEAADSYRKMNAKEYETIIALWKKTNRKLTKMIKTSHKRYRKKAKANPTEMLPIPAKKPMTQKALAELAEALRD